MSAEPIKIGIMINLSGAYGQEGIRARLLLTAAVTEINAKGGVYLKGDNAYHLVDLIYYDGESNVQKFLELTTKMITEKQVHAIIFLAAPPPYLIPAVIQAERLGGVPVLSGIIDTLWDNAAPNCPGGKFTWNWMYSFNYTHWSFAWKELLLQYKDKTNGLVGIVATDDVSGHDAIKKHAPVLEDAGFKIFFPGYVPPGCVDFTAIVNKFKEQNVDILYVNTSPIEWIPFRRQMVAMDFKPKIIAVGRCMQIPEAEILGDMAEGVMVECQWWPTYPYAGNDWIREKWSLVSGGLAPSFADCWAYSRLLIVLEAAKIAGRLDGEAINNAMLQIDMELPAGPCKFDPKTHSCAGVATIGQFVITSEGKFDINIIWAPPNSRITPKPAIFPMPK